MNTFQSLKTNKPDLDRLIQDHLDEVKSHARVVKVDPINAEKIYYNYVLFLSSRELKVKRETYVLALQYTHDVIEKWVELLKLRLGPGWDVVVESDHLHVERDPKKKPLDPI